MYVSVRKHKKEYIRYPQCAYSRMLPRRRCVDARVLDAVPNGKGSKVDGLSGCTSGVVTKARAIASTGECRVSDNHPMIFAVAYFHREIDSPSENGSYTRPPVHPLLLCPRTPSESSLSPFSTCTWLRSAAYACLASRFFRNRVPFEHYNHSGSSSSTLRVRILWSLEWRWKKKRIGIQLFS